MTFQEVGPENAFRYLLNLGFSTLEGTLPDGRHFRDTNPATPLGGLTLGVTQLELAASYAVMANGGQYNRPVFYTRVLGPDGRIILENNNNPVQVISPPAAYILTDMMTDTMTATGATGHRAAFRNLRMPISGKTGTSQREEDLGFTGFTPYFTAAVWLGHDTPRTLGTGSIHLDIWREIMQQIHIELELPFREFSRPDGVINGSICRISGLAPSDLCRSAGTVVSDLFVVGSIPTEHCTQHSISWICSLGGVPATEFCPRDFWVEGVASASGECPVHPPFDLGDLPSLPDSSFWGFPDTNLPSGPTLPAFPDLDSSWNFDALPTPEPEPMPPTEGDVIQQPLPPENWPPSDGLELIPPPVEEFPIGDFDLEQQTETEPNWFS
jgi:penicillin-binding protein 1A